MLIHQKAWKKTTLWRRAKVTVGEERKIETNMYFLLLLFFMTGRENLITDRSAHIQYSLTSTHKECLCNREEKHGEEYVTNRLITI